MPRNTHKNTFTPKIAALDPAAKAKLVALFKKAGLTLKGA